MPTAHLTQATINLGGSPLSTSYYHDLEELVVDSTLNMPSMCTLRFYDPELAHVDDALFALGKELDVSFTPGGETTQVKVFAGEITSIEPYLSAAGINSLVIRAYDKSHRLHRGRKTRTFLQKSDSDLVSTIAGEAGLSVEVDATSVVHEYIVQYNQTNMEFLRERAERIGYVLYVTDNKLYFKKGETFAVSGPTLKLGETLSQFEPRMVSVGQAEKTELRGWDAKKKAEIVATSAPPGDLNQGGMTKTGGAAAQTAFSSAQETIVNQPVFTVNEGQLLVKQLDNDIGLEAMQAEGVCYGNPKILAGMTVTVSNVGTRFSGKYFVTSAKHVYNANGYDTFFSGSGRAPNTFRHLLGVESSDVAQGKIDGVVPAIVTNLADPDNLGRVKVKFPWLGEIESFWVRIATPMAGSSRGMMYMPEVNDEVLLAFEHGDMRHAYVIGALWSNTDKPPLTNSDINSSGKVKKHIIKSRLGHTIVFTDEDSGGNQQITLTTAKGSKVLLVDDDGKEGISIIDKTGNNSIVIDSAKNSVTINVAGDFSVTAKGKITMNSTADMSLDSKASMKVSSMAAMNMESKASTTVKGTQMTVEGSAMTSVKSSGITEVKGTMVKIN